MNIKWVSVKKKMPKIGDTVSIYGVLFAFRQQYPKGSIKKTIEHNVTYYGIRSIKGESPRHWFGGWCVDEHDPCVTHWIKLPEPKFEREF